MIAASDFNLITNGITPGGSSVIRIRNETEETQNFRLEEVGGTFDEVLSVPPGDGTFGTDYFVSLTDASTVKLTPVSKADPSVAIGPTKTKAVDTSGNNIYTGDFDYIEGTGPVCFTRGTALRTDRGDRPVEDLQPGDRVLCMDGSFHEIRWVGQRQIDARGTYAPIQIDAGTFGNRNALRFSPAHRIRVANLWAEMLFGTPAVLVAVQDLLSVPGVRRVPCPVVDYYHILLDDHQMVLSEGLWSETLNPMQAIDTLDRRALSEVLALFPALDAASPTEIPPVLPTLSPMEVTHLLKLITRG
ncbi:MAG: Hint domain-containing protein [Pseudomonadota bacterium]